MKRILILFLFGLSLLSCPLFAEPVTVTQTAEAGSFPLVTSESIATLVVDSADAEVVTIAATALSNDIKLITGTTPAISNQITEHSLPVLIGTIGQSELIDSLIGLGKLSTANIAGEWETFCITLINNPFSGIDQALVIYGSDPRGTAFGVFEFSKRMGVSPWVWWADVTPEPRSALYVTPGENIVGPPSVKYRGIFINDEDWGIKPWASAKMDTDIEDIGPKTYEKVFELLLRCKANYIWPAMHECTKAFWYYKENPVLARKYQIVLGSSHCEQMLRNNVDEWQHNFESEYGVTPGDWNWATNSTQITKYWEDRVIESKNNDAVYTIGMRGIHDSDIPGYSTTAEKCAALNDIIATQRNMFVNDLGKDATEVPQIFCPYKEVLDLYRAGINLPEDVTLAWADDNFGYIRQLSNPEEQLRSGGSGVYYHLSYYGLPLPNLWLSSYSPSLICSELSKAYALNAKRVWIINVGDIKPAEMEMQFAMDLAWDVDAWTPETAYLYAEEWAAETFGSELAEPIRKIKQDYYKLAATGRPEFMPVLTFTRQEMEVRLALADSLIAACDKVKTQIPERLSNAFYELIEYPVKAAANTSILYTASDLSFIYADEGRSDALNYAEQAKKANNAIIALTNQYNTGIAGGKWNGMMDYNSSWVAITSQSVATSVVEKEIPPAGYDSVQIIPASGYSAADGAGFSMTTIKDVGCEGSSLTVLPLNMTTYTEANVTTAPYAEYDVKVNKGINTITVKCLPTFPLYESMQLRFALSIDGSVPEFFNIATSAETSAWSTNLERGYVYGQSSYFSTSVKTIKVRVYFTDPGLVVSAITYTGINENAYTARMTNPNFEMKAADTYNDGTTVRGIPYGWQSTGTLSGNSYGINADATNYSGQNLCWINSTPMPAKYELYQEVNDLPAGDYLVRCRLAVMSNTVTNQRLFANDQVQYFGSESDYQSNLTDGEVNTFAGYTPSSAYNLKEMAVRVHLDQGDPLKLGIRSSNLKSNGSTATNNSGWFKVDYFRIEPETLTSNQTTYDTGTGPKVSVTNTNKGINVSVNQSFNHGEVWFYTQIGTLVHHQVLSSRTTSIPVMQSGFYVGRVVVDGNVTPFKSVIY